MDGSSTHKRLLGPSEVVSERPGHSDIAITLNTYSHAISAMEAEAAEKVAALVAGG